LGSGNGGRVEYIETIRLGRVWVDRPSIRGRVRLQMCNKNTWYFARLVDLPYIGILWRLKFWYSLFNFLPSLHSSDLRPFLPFAGMLMHRQKFILRSMYRIGSRKWILRSMESRWAGSFVMEILSRSSTSLLPSEKYPWICLGDTWWLAIHIWGVRNCWSMKWKESIQIEILNNKWLWMRSNQSILNPSLPLLPKSNLPYFSWHQPLYSYFRSSPHPSPSSFLYSSGTTHNTGSGFSLANSVCNPERLKCMATAPHRIYPAGSWFPIIIAESDDQAEVVSCSHISLFRVRLWAWV
jgi:hypothetical protein